MLKKGFKQLLAEANAEIESISVAEGLALMGDPGVVFLDVRERQERAQSFIPDSMSAPRGFLEFIADPEGPMHDPRLNPGKLIVVYCASGGRAALAAKTLKDMGFPRVASLVGGFQAWQAADGETAS